MEIYSYGKFIIRVMKTYHVIKPYIENNSNLVIHIVEFTRDYHESMRRRFVLRT